MQPSVEIFVAHYERTDRVLCLRSKFDMRIKHPPDLTYVFDNRLLALSEHWHTRLDLQNYTSKLHCGEDVFTAYGVRLEKRVLDAHYFLKWIEACLYKIVALTAMPSAPNAGKFHQSDRKRIEKGLKVDDRRFQWVGV